jgi:hypothetical protein
MPSKSYVIRITGDKGRGMLELMMAGKKSSSAPSKPDFGFNFDKMVSTGTTAISVTNASGYQKATPVAITGYTKTMFGTGSPTFPIVPATVFNYLTGDFTVEAVFMVSSTTNGYATIFAQNNGSNIGLVIRIGDSGFGNRLQVSTSPGTASKVFSTKFTRADLYNKWTHIAVQRVAGKLSVYVNGVLQGLAVGTGSDYSSTTQPSTESLSLTSSQQLALITAGYLCITEIAVNKVAKYAANFTPTYPLYPTT